MGQRYRKPGTNFVTARTLRRTGLLMLPFLRAIAKSQAFAQAWTSALLALDLERMQKLLRTVSPLARTEQLGIGTNGIGYFFSLPVSPPPNAAYVSGVTIVPGTAQFTFSTNAHRRIARALLPLYKELAFNECFREALAKAIRRGDSSSVSLMIRPLIRSTAVRGIAVESAGVTVSFKFKGLKQTYISLFFKESN